MTQKVSMTIEVDWVDARYVAAFAALLGRDIGPSGDEVVSLLFYLLDIAGDELPAKELCEITDWAKRVEERKADFEKAERLAK